MTTHRFFVAPDEASGDRFALPASIARQVRTVLRLRDGDGVVLLTGDGNELACRVEGDECVVDARRPAAGEPAHRLTVVQAVLKGDGLDDVVRQGTELGVAAFRLVVAERSVARDVSDRRLERLRAIAREAAEQSERGRVPPVEVGGSLVDEIGPGAVVLAEREDGVRLGALATPDAIVIGPEGGWTDGELARAASAGARFAGLGPRILRSRSVAPAAAAVILSRTGDFA